MAYGIKDKKKESIVDETQRLWRLYSNNRSVWAEHAIEDREFRLGKQWSSEQEEKLKSRGQAPIVVNRIHPAVEAAKAMLTSHKPSFRVSGKEDSDNKVSQVFNALIEYMWQHSDGDMQLRTAVDDYYVTGMGCLLAYQDPIKDMGKGEVCVRAIDPLDVYVDPNARDRFFDDAENIIISRLFTKEQAQKLYPRYESAIKNAGSSNYTDMPGTSRVDNGEVTFPEDVLTNENNEYIRGYERYYKVLVAKHRIFETFSGKEDLLEPEEFEQYVQQPAWIFNGQPIVEEQIAMQLQQQGQEVMPVSYQDLIEYGLIQVVKVQVERVKQCIIMGDKKLYSRILPTEHYPLVPINNLHTRTPYPMSDVRMVKGLQEYINKTRSLIIAHATTSTNAKILIPEGSVDMKEFEEKWAQPGVAIPIDFAEGQPIHVQPSPLPNELYKNEADAKADIDHELGLYELMMGNAGAAPQTYKATISIDEFGQRKMKSKQMDIEAALTRMARVVIPFMQQLYQVEKVFRIVQPNNSLSEYVINQRLVDDKTGQVQVFNDITVGKYDVVAVSGSTMPTNRYAELELYMDAYKNGIIDRNEVLKKTEIFDMEGVLQRTDLVTQLQQQLQSAQEQIKDLSGDLQSRDREAVNLRKKVETEKFKSKLDKLGNKSSAASNLFEHRLNDLLDMVKDEVKREIRDKMKDDTPKKDSSKKKDKK